MNYESLHEEREDIRIKAHILECINDASHEPIEYWLVTLLEGLNEIRAEESSEKPHERSTVEKDLQDTITNIAIKAEELNNNRKTPDWDTNKTETVRKEILDLVKIALERYRGKLVIRDAILLKEPVELEDKILDIIDNYILKSKYLRYTVFLLLVAISFAGFGTWQLYSGAQSAGEIVNEMNTRVIEAQGRIDKITGNLATLLTEKATETVEKIEKNVEINVTNQVKTHAIKKIDVVLAPKSAEKRVEAFIEEKVGPEIEKINIETNVGTAITDDVQNRVKIAFDDSPVDKRIEPILNDMIGPRVNEIDHTAMVKTMVQTDVSDRVKDLFATTSAEQRVTEIIKNKVETKIKPIDIQDKVDSVIGNEVKSRIDGVLDKKTQIQKVDGAINTWVKYIAERNEINVKKLNLQPLTEKLELKKGEMKELEVDINKLQEQVKTANKDMKFSVIEIWNYADWPLKTSLVLFYLPFLGVIVFVCTKIFLFIRRKFS